MPNYEDDLSVSKPVEGAVFKVSQQSGEVQVGGNSTDGEILLYRAEENPSVSSTSSIRLDANKAIVRAGGNGVGASLTLFKQDEVDVADRHKAAIDLNVTEWATMRIGRPGSEGKIAIFPKSAGSTNWGKASIQMDGKDGYVRLGGGGSNGTLRMFPAEVTVIGDHDLATVRIEASTGSLQLGRPGQEGDLMIFPKSAESIDASQASIHLDAEHGNALLGGGGVDGDLLLFRSSATSKSLSKASIHLDAETAEAFLGGEGQKGDLYLFSSNAASKTPAEASIHLDGSEANAFLGGKGQDGDLFLFNSSATSQDWQEASIHLDGEEANAFLGGKGQDGDLYLFDSSATSKHPAEAAIHFNAELGEAFIGGKSKEGNLYLFSSNAASKTPAEASIHLNGETGDIILRNADCAEEFDVVPGSEAAPGMVMVINDDALLEPCTRPSDRRVAGVVSGAGEYRPAVVLDRRGSGEGRLPIALVGKVYVYASAENGPIRVGDMLTSSSTPGHAMRAGSVEESFGAVIGKALAPLDAETGLIPMMVSAL